MENDVPHTGQATDIYIGARLRSARLTRNLSLRALASSAGVSASLLSQIELGKANPSVRSLYSIAASLSLPVDYFFPNGAANEANGNPVPAVALDRTASEFRTASQESTADLLAAATGAQPWKSAGPVIRRHARLAIRLSGGVIWARLTPSPEKWAEFLEICYDVGGMSGRALSHHAGREFGLVLGGELVVELGFESYTLRPGDSIVFDSNTPHRLTNAGESVVRAVWVTFERE